MGRYGEARLSHRNHPNAEPALVRLNMVLEPRTGSSETAVTDFGYAIAVSRYDDGHCKVSLVARPHRVLGRLRISLSTGRATTTLVALPGQPAQEFRWWGPIDLEVANRTLEAQYRSNVQAIESGPSSSPSSGPGSMPTSGVRARRIHSE